MREYKSRACSMKCLRHMQLLTSSLSFSLNDTRFFAFTLEFHAPSLKWKPNTPAD